MEEIKVCRVCLIVNVKMFPLQGALENSLNNLIGVNMQSLMPLPSYVCYECAELVKKYTKFRDKCLIARSILCDILRINNELSEYEIKSIDRKETNLESHLIISPILHEICLPGMKELEVKDESITLEMIVEDSNSFEQRSDRIMDDCGDVDQDSDSNDDIPLKFIIEDTEPVKKPKKREAGTKLHVKLEKLKKPVRSKKRKPVNEDGLTEDEVAMSKDFDVTKLTIEQQIVEIEKRKETPNYKDSPYKCEHCFKGFLQEETLKNHSVRHDSSAGHIECVVCHSRFALRRAYKLHAARHAKRYSCRSCNFVTVHMDQAKKHKQWHDGVIYKCQYCNEISTKLTSYLSHVRMKHPSQWVCSMCGYSFVSDKGLRMHVSRMHRGAEEANSKPKDKDVESSEESNLYCKDCDVRFATEAAWKRHMVTSAKHTSDLGNGCRHCGDTFPSAQLLRAHTHSHALNLRARSIVARRRYVPRGAAGGSNCAPATYPVTCEHCDETIPNRSRHWIHYQRSHQDKKYPLSESRYICEICGKGFKANALLVYHARTHTSSREYACSHAHCGSAFHTRAALAAHARTHARARPHACECGKAFKSKLGLRQHMKSHEGVRPFRCPHCGKTFSRGSGLNLHVKHVHLRLPSLLKDDNVTDTVCNDFIIKN